jgi:rhodanese-related sulfurtransferase
MRFSTRKRANISESSNATGRSEHVEQREFVSWFRKSYESIRIIAIPNGGQRNIATAVRLKAEGVTAGVPDLLIPAWNLWIEMKREKGGSVSKNQLDWHNYLRSIKQNVIVAKGFEDAKSQIEEFTTTITESDNGTEPD